MLSLAERTVTASSRIGETMAVQLTFESYAVIGLIFKGLRHHRGTLEKDPWGDDTSIIIISFESHRICLIHPGREHVEDIKCRAEVSSSYFYHNYQSMTKFHCSFDTVAAPKCECFVLFSKWSRLVYLHDFCLFLCSSLIYMFPLTAKILYDLLMF